MKRLKRKNFLEKIPEGAKLVARPSRWGNPYPKPPVVGKYVDNALELILKWYREWLDIKLRENPEFLEPLRGFDLVCYCDLDKPCHADILLEYMDISRCPMCGDKMKLMASNEHQKEHFHCSTCNWWKLTEKVLVSDV